MSTVKPTRRGYLGRAVAAVAIFVSSVGVAVGGASPVSAACPATKAWTSRYAGYSETFQISYYSTCNDLNAAYAYSVADEVRGWYISSSGGWTIGDAGYEYVETYGQYWDVLLTNINDGATVRGQGKNRSQYVNYRH